MPIYAYKCASCGHAKDVLQKMSDAPLTTCPACGAQAFSKQVTAAGFQLKGSGWYATDFRNNNSGPAPAKPDEAKAGETQPADSKASDAKPADKSDSKPAESKPADSKPAKPADGAAAPKTGTPSASAAGHAGAHARA